MRFKELSDQPMPPRVTLSTLDQKLDFLLSTLEKHVKTDDAHFERIGDVLDGNGTLGMKTRVDRLEQSESTRKWHIRTLWAAIVTGVCTWFVGLVK